MEYTPANTNITSFNTTNKSSITFDAKRYLGAILSNWYWIVLSILIALFIAFLYLQVTKPIYAIRASLLVAEESAGNSSEILDKLNIVKKAPVNLYNEINAIRSEELVKEVVDSLDLNITYAVRSKLHSRELYKESPIKIVFDSSGYKGDHTVLNLKYTADGHFDLKDENKSMDVTYDTWINKPYGRFKIEYEYNPSSPNKYLLAPITVTINDIDYTVREILNNLKVTSDDGRASVLDLYYKDNIPARGIDLLNMLIHIYYRQKLKNIDLSAQQTRDFINQRKEALMNDMNAIDSNVESIKAATGMTDIQEQTTTIVSKKNDAAKDVDRLMAKKRALLNLRYLLLNSRYQVIVPLDIDDQILLGLITQYNSLVQKLETQEKVQELGPSNPFIVETIVELDALKKRMLDVLNRITGTIESNIQVATQTETQYTNRIKSVPNIDRKITQVKRGYDVLQNMYLFLFQKGVENELSVYNESNKSKVLVAPFAASAPISPIKKNVYLLALLLGLLIPLIILFIRQLLIAKVVNESDIRALTDIPIIGIISKSIPENLRNNYIAISPSMRTGIAEQFRMLRTNLEFITFTENKKVITVTSSDSGEGKTFVSVNLGLILALGTRRVIVVEFDLRKPKMSDLLKVNETVGVSDYLTGTAELRDIIKPSGINSNLYIATCGQIPPNPGDLLAYPSTTKLIEELQEMFDVVVIDTPPIGLVSDALSLSKLAGLNIFVVRQAVTYKKQVVDYDSLYKEGKIHNPAIVFNGVGYHREYGYYSDPNKDYEQKLSDYTAPYDKKGLFSFFKKQQ